MPIIIAAIVGYGTFFGYVAVDTGAAKTTFTEMANDINPTVEHQAKEAQQMLLDGYGETEKKWEVE